MTIDRHHKYIYSFYIQRLLTYSDPDQTSDSRPRSNINITTLKIYFTLGFIVYYILNY